MAMSIGGEYNQDGVILFSSAKDDGSSTMYTLTEVPDPDEAVASMRKNGIDGGRLVQGKGGMEPKPESIARALERKRSERNEPEEAVRNDDKLPGSGKLREQLLPQMAATL